MWIDDYQWHYDYVRLAWDTGFSFEKCKSPKIDKSKIYIADIDRIVKERDVASVDRYISTVVQYILDEEQAQVLDTNFVKLFRISQLAVEYLLFCKKYLDNTVVLLKRELNKCKEETRQLNVVINDLQNHIETLSQSYAIATFKCSVCSKAFASEEYLNSHIKRRHNRNNENYNSETDKLNLEIKELKERLNSTEKLLKEKDAQIPEKYIKHIPNNDDNVDKFLEIHEKFETFKKQVDNELRDLKMQKAFYEEKYGKLFDIMTQNKGQIDESKPPQPQEVAKTETTTQTDKLLQIENISEKNVLIIKDPGGSISEEAEKDDKASLEVQISQKLIGIEGQMQTFLDKLNRMENATSVANHPQSLPHPTEVKPRAKPRSKLSQPTANTVEQSKSPENAEKLKRAIQEMARKQEEEEEEEEEEKEEYHNKEIVVIHERKPSNLQRQPPIEKSDNEDSEELDSESETETPNSVEEQDVEDQKNDIKVQKKNEAIKDTSKLNKEIRMLLNDRLRDLGILDSWTRLPHKSFSRALEMLNHQAEMNKKSYPSFTSIKKKIMENVEEQCHERSLIKDKTRTMSKNSRRLDKVRNVVKVSYRTKPSPKEKPAPSPQKVIEIKNRALYDSDSDTELSYQPPHLKEPTDLRKKYLNVVQEIKSLPNVKNHTDEESADELHKDGQKGVLKNFPSVSSLNNKKKVIFDLDSKSSKGENVHAAQRTGDSTTSVASSILGEKVEVTKQKEDDFDGLENLSDFDFSDI